MALPDLMFAEFTAEKKQTTKLDNRFYQNPENVQLSQEWHTQQSDYFNIPTRFWNKLYYTHMGII